MLIKALKEEIYLIVPGKVKGILFPESCLFTQNQARCCLFFCDHFIITSVLTNNSVGRGWVVGTVQIEESGKGGAESALVSLRISQEGLLNKSTLWGLSDEIIKIREGETVSYSWKTGDTIIEGVFCTLLI